MRFFLFPFVNETSSLPGAEATEWTPLIVPSRLSFHQDDNDMSYERTRSFKMWSQILHTEKTTGIKICVCVGIMQYYHHMYETIVPHPTTNIQGTVKGIRVQFHFHSSFNGWRSFLQQLCSAGSGRKTHFEWELKLFFQMVMKVSLLISILPMTIPNIPNVWIKKTLFYWTFRI